MSDKNLVLEGAVSVFDIFGKLGEIFGDIGNISARTLKTLAATIDDVDLSSLEINKFTDSNDMSSPSNQKTLENLQNQRREVLQEKSKQWKEEMDKRNEEAKRRLAEQMEESNAKMQADADELNKQLAENAALAKQAQAHIYRMQVFNEQGMHNELDNEAQAAKQTLNAAVAKFANTSNNFQKNKFVPANQQTPQKMQIGKLGSLPTLGGSTSQQTNYSDKINAMFENRYQSQPVKFGGNQADYIPIEDLPPIEPASYTASQNVGQSITSGASSETPPSERTTFLDDILGMPPAYGDTVTPHQNSQNNDIYKKTLLYAKINKYKIDPLMFNKEFLRFGLNVGQNLIAKNLPLTFDLWNHSMTNLHSVISDPNANFIENSDKRLSEITGKTGKNLEQFKQNTKIFDTPGIEYSSNSPLSKAIKNSDEFKQKFKQILPEIQQKGIFVGKKHLEFDKPLDLKLAIHGGNILRAEYDKNGNIKILVVDVYDFKSRIKDCIERKDYRMLKDYVLKDTSTTAINDFATLLQYAKLIKNYYIIDNIIILKDELKDMKNGH